MGKKKHWRHFKSSHRRQICIIDGNKSDKYNSRGNAA
jgi:hypothetical protein